MADVELPQKQVFALSSSVIAKHLRMLTHEEQRRLLINTTTLNSFKVNHKAYIPGLELGLEIPSNFAGMQKHLKILSFHF